MIRVLITGAAGFIGSHLAKACATRGYDVHLIIRPSTRAPRLQDLVGSVTIHRLDLVDGTALERCLPEVSPDIVFHLASRPREPEPADLSDAPLYVDQELRILVSLLRILANVPSPPQVLVRTGSLAEYGMAQAPLARRCGSSR